MLNRFWMVAALAAVFACGGFVSAQEKKGAEIKIPKGLSAEKLKASVQAATPRDQARAIDIGGGGGSGIANAAALYKALEELGVLTPGEQPSDGRFVTVNRVGLYVFMTDDNAYINSLGGWELKNRDTVPGSNLLGLMAISVPGDGIWAFKPQANLLTCGDRLPSKHATKAGLSNQLKGIAAAVLEGLPHFASITKSE